MLELLLAQYHDTFGEDFPLIKFKGRAEIDVINIVYDCLMNNEPFKEEKPIANRFPGAPGMKD